MTTRTTFSMLAFLCLAATAAAQVGQPLSITSAQAVTPASVTATGRLQTVVSARLSPRVSGHLAEIGTDSQGRRLDAGMLVTKGQVLFRLDDTTHANRLESAQAALASANAALENLKAKTRPEVLEQLRQALAELDLRIANQEKDYERYKRLVEVDKTLPEKRLEDATLELERLKVQRKAAAARLQEAENGATPTEVAVAEARVKEAQVAVKAAQDDVRDTVVRAPFDGMITRRMKSPGDYIASAPPTEVMEIVSLDDMEVEYRLPEKYLGRIEEGKTPVKLSSALLASPLDTTVTRVIREIDPAKGTFACRTVLTAQQRGNLLPGAFVTAELQLGSTTSEVIVPQRAVGMEGPEATVFVAVDGTMKRVRVELGDKLTEGVLVRSGLKAGDQVLVGPAELLKDGATLPEYLLKTVKTAAHGGAAAATRP